MGMRAGTDRAGGAVAPPGLADGQRRSTLVSSRLQRVRSESGQIADFVQSLLQLATDVIPKMYMNGEFVFRLVGQRAGDQWILKPEGVSARYAAITVLGLLRLSEQDQRRVFGGADCRDFMTQLIARSADIDNVGDVALICWAAAESGHPDLQCVLHRLSELRRISAPRSTIEAAWAVTALAAARPYADVEDDLRKARDHLINARDRVLFPHVTDHSGSWYRAHVGSFADQVYPMQALARLHASASDPEALAIANSIADVLCVAQGSAGQWWWHYDSRNGRVVEEYPVYSVHQHAMAPMTMMDLADAGGNDHFDAVCRGLQWLKAPLEAGEPLVPPDCSITWRKVARADPRKAVRGLRAATTRIVPRWQLRALDRFFPPGIVDHECRPYELGWLLMTWLPRAPDKP